MVVRPCAGRDTRWATSSCLAIGGEATCLFDIPERQEEVAEGREFGGLRRRRDKDLAGAGGLEGAQARPPDPEAGDARRDAHPQPHEARRGGDGVKSHGANETARSSPARGPASSYSSMVG
jgi:hypothetical protein